MNILILSPLFPPDVGAPASYVKELAFRLQTHTVTLAIYGYLPEAVPGSFITVDKRVNLTKRLFLYTKQLFSLQKTNDLLIVNNAPSTELPALLLSFFYTGKMVLCISDPLAAKKSPSGVYGFIHRLLRKRCTKVITLPNAQSYETPEKLPFTSLPPQDIAVREEWWENHIAELLSYE